MGHRVCPWWIGYFLASPLRKLRQDPHAILSPLVGEGMVVLEPGPGMGFFTLELARLVGPRGRVVAMDVQAKMLRALRRRARRRGLLERIETREVGAEGLPVGDLAGRADFALAFAMVHEVPDAARFFTDVAAALKPGARLLLAEPAGHVNAAAFGETLGVAARAGFRVESRPAIRASHAALLVRA
jgi:ubiquinone/menaquinone biosynthesis C-methylase UbiE